jgi:hypothetical protein
MTSWMKGEFFGRPMRFRSCYSHGYLSYRGTAKATRRPSTRVFSNHIIVVIHSLKTRESGLEHHWQQACSARCDKSIWGHGQGHGPPGTGDRDRVVWLCSGPRINYELEHCKSLNLSLARNNWEGQSTSRPMMKSNFSNRTVEHGL